VTWWQNKVRYTNIREFLFAISNAFAITYHMKITIEVPDYNPSQGIKSTWEPGFEIEVKHENGQTILLANKNGLTSLAIQLLTLAQDEVPAGVHLHLDEHNSLEEGSVELVIAKK
jgi:hypothetical protein